MIISYMIYKENTNLSKLTTLGLGGLARHFFVVSSKDDVVEALKFAKKNNLKTFVLGGGSNIVVSDKGFDGVVIKNEIGGVEFSGNTAEVGSGESWDSFVDDCAKRGLSGVENLSGIPGSVGASPIQNIGAYGQEAGETIKEVCAINRETLEHSVFLNKDCHFDYRKSIFNTTQKDKYFITSVIFFLGRARPEELIKKRKEILETRKGKGHLAPPLGPMSAGSFFKNPIVSKDKFTKIKENMAGEGWFWPVSPSQNRPKEGKIKISAARLIEEAGFKKGMRRGSFGISPLHSLVLVNFGGANARELILFAEEIKSEVESKFGVILNMEPQLVGF